MKALPEYDPAKALTLPWVPDQELIQCLAEHGMPKHEARQGVDVMRLFATSFYFDVIEARKGDKDAKERVDYCRHIWNEQAKRAKADKPGVSISVPHSI